MSITFYLVEFILLLVVSSIQFDTTESQSMITSNSATEPTTAPYSNTGSMTTSNSITGPTTAPYSNTGSMTTSNSITGPTTASHSNTGSMTTSNSITGPTTASHSNTGSMTTSNSITGPTTASHSNTGSMATTNSITGPTTAHNSNTGSMTTSNSNNVITETTGLISFSTANSASPTTTNTPAYVININATYSYPIVSDNSLKIGIVNYTNATNSVQNLVNNSFNLPAFNIIVLQIRIQLRAKTIQNFDLIVDVSFRSNGPSCDITCIDSARLTPNTTVSLPNEDGTPVSVPVQSLPTRISVTPVIYPVGGRSPGLPGQLGMGLGISLFFVLLIATVIVLYWKFGLSNEARRQEYAMTRY